MMRGGQVTFCQPSAYIKNDLAKALAELGKSGLSSKVLYTVNPVKAPFIINSYRNPKAA